MAAGLIGGQNGDDNESGRVFLGRVQEQVHGGAVDSSSVVSRALQARRAGQEVDEPPPPILPDLPPVTTLPYVEPPPFDICVYAWPCAEAERIVYGFSVQCPTGESGGDAGAVSWDGSSYGLWQINAIHFWRWPNARSEWMLPMTNTKWAYELWLEQGWAPWDCA